MVPSMRTRTCMDGSSGLAKLSCTPAQHIGMLAESTSRGRAVTLGGATQGKGRNMKLTNTTKLAQVHPQLTGDNHFNRSCNTPPH